MPSEWTTLQVDGSPMRNYVSSPDLSGPFSPVVVAMQMTGVDGFLRDRCDSLAEAGYVIAAPYFYHRPTERSMEALHSLATDDPRRLEWGFSTEAKLVDSEVAVDVDAALALLLGLPSVGNGPAGITGFCIGGCIA